MPQYRTVKKGSTDPLVKPLKKALNEVLSPSPCLAEDTLFDNTTDAAVRQFQTVSGMSEDGVVGPQTWKRLLEKSADVSLRASIDALVGKDDDETDPESPLPNTSGLSEEFKYYFYLTYICILGQCPTAVANLQEGKRVILGLRVTTNSRTKKGAGSYDDRFVVLQNNGGVLTAKEFKGNTDPSSRYEHGYKHAAKAYGEDANEDGVKDLGRIPAGSYDFKKEYSGTYGNVLRPVAAITAERDINHDGNFDANDVATKPSALSAGTSMLFHKGGNNMTGSAGCQTMPPETFGKFWNALGPQKQFRYVLVKVR